MNLFEQTISQIKKTRESVERGDVVFLDLEDTFPRFSKFVPGFIKEDYLLVTANSGVGKSRFVRFLCKSFVNLARKDTKLKLKIFINSLEESEQKVISSFIIPYVFEKYGERITYHQLFYPRKDNMLSEKQIKMIEDGMEYYKIIEQYIEVVSIAAPFGFYKKVRDYLFEVGKFYYVDRTGDTITKTQVKRGEKWNHYEYDDPNLFVICVSDNINNYSKENSFTWYDSIKRFSSYYCRQLLCLVCKCIIINIHQQASDKEKIETNYKGQTIEKKLEPSLDGLGDIKIIQRDCTIALGLFSPARYDIRSHGGYNIDKIGEFYRSLHILKNREGIADKTVALFADLSRDYFKELPQEDSKKGKVYKLVEKLKE